MRSGPVSGKKVKNTSQLSHLSWHTNCSYECSLWKSLLKATYKFWFVLNRIFVKVFSSSFDIDMFVRQAAEQLSSRVFVVFVCRVMHQIENYFVLKLVSTNQLCIGCSWIELTAPRWLVVVSDSRSDTSKLKRHIVSVWLPRIN